MTINFVMSLMGLILGLFLVYFGVKSMNRLKKAGIPTNQGVGQEMFTYGVFIFVCCLFLLMRAWPDHSKQVIVKPAKIYRNTLVKRNLYADNYDCKILIHQEIGGFELQIGTANKSNRNIELSRPCALVYVSFFEDGSGFFLREVRFRGSSKDIKNSGLLTPLQDNQLYRLADYMYDLSSIIKVIIQQ